MVNYDMDTEWDEESRLFHHFVSYISEPNDQYKYVKWDEE